MICSVFLHSCKAHDSTKYSHCSLAHAPSVIGLHISVHPIFQASKITLHHFTFCSYKAGEQHPAPYFMISLQKT